MSQMLNQKTKKVESHQEVVVDHLGRHRDAITTILTSKICVRSCIAPDREFNNNTLLQDDRRLEVVRCWTRDLVCNFLVVVTILNHHTMITEHIRRPPLMAPHHLTCALLPILHTLTRNSTMPGIYNMAHIGAPTNKVRLIHFFFCNVYFFYDDRA